VSAGLAVAAMAAVGVGTAAVPATGSPESVSTGRVPEEIRVPAGHRLIAVMPAQGVQTYQCTGGAWTFLQPDAILQHRGRATVLHTRGPVWTSTRDGSSVTGAAQASSPVEGAIPQLLLRATANRGPGLLAAVTYVQRLHTTGGLAPAGACAESTTVSVPYTADYTFWVAVSG